MSNLPDLIASDYNSLILRFKSFENDILTNGKENISKESQVFLKHLITCNHYYTYGLKLYIDSLEAVYIQKQAFSRHMKNQIIIKHTSKKINEDQLIIDHLKSLIESSGLKYD